VGTDNPVACVGHGQGHSFAAPGERDELGWCALENRLAVFEQARAREGFVELLSPSRSMA
jgi:hypothetical protein